MLTTDLALRTDPAYEKISRRFLENPDEFALAFAKAWYKLLHRDMGPVSRYLGPWVPEPQLWQDPVPAVDHELVGDGGRRRAQGEAPRLRPDRLSSWSPPRGPRPPASAAPTCAAARTAPASGWRRSATGRSTSPAELAKVLRDPRAGPAGVQRRAVGGKRISLADLIVLGGCAGVEKAAKDAGHDVTVPFTPGRTDASQEQTDVESFAVLEPRADGFRNYVRAGREAAAGDAAARPGQPAHAHGPGDDRPGRRHAGARRQHRRHPPRRLHRPAGHADQRLLREPARRRARSGRTSAARRTSTRAATGPPAR